MTPSQPLRSCFTFPLVQMRILVMPCIVAEFTRSDESGYGRNMCEFEHMNRGIILENRTEEFTRLRELRNYTSSLIVASAHASTFMAVSPEEKRTFIQEFVFFLKTFGVIGLAIAFVIGQAASTLVNAFVKDIIDPFIGLFLPAGSLAAVTIKVPNLAGSTSEFKIGDLISSIINFIVIALVVFVAYKQLSRYGIVEDKTKGEKK